MPELADRRLKRAPAPGPARAIDEPRIVSESYSVSSTAAGGTGFMVDFRLKALSISGLHVTLKACSSAFLSDFRNTLYWGRIELQLGSSEKHPIS
jgi:hypothetical protein